MTITAFAAAAIALAVMPQGRPDTHTLGKTPQQVVAMGRQKWFDFYTESQGSSTHAMADAERTFAVCLAFSNNEKIAKLPEEKRGQYDKLRELMRSAALAAVEGGSALTGGGSMWINISAGQDVNVEEVIADLVDMPAKPKSATQASYWKQASKSKALVVKHADDINEMASEYGLRSIDVLARVDSINEDFLAAAKLIEKWPAKSRGRVIFFFVDAVGLISDEML